MSACRESLPETCTGIRSESATRRGLPKFLRQWRSDRSQGFERRAPLRGFIVSVPRIMTDKRWLGRAVNGTDMRADRKAVHECVKVMFAFTSPLFAGPTGETQFTLQMP